MCLLLGSSISGLLAVYLILGHYYEHVGLMLSLERKGLLDNGDFFVVGVDLEQYAASEPEKYLRGVLNNETEQAAIRAYQSYLAIIPSAPVDFDEFAKQVSGRGCCDKVINGVTTLDKQRIVK